MTANRPDRPGKRTEGAPRDSAERERQRQNAIEANKRDSIPILEELGEAGLHVEWISDLYARRLQYKEAIPILLRWLPRTVNNDVKEAIVRALSVPWAKPDAATALVREFRNLPPGEAPGLQWAIGNALAVVADDSVASDLEDMIRDARYGKAREMLVVALGNMKEPRAQETLLQLLSDDALAGYAIMSLGKLRARKAAPMIKRFENHPQAWIRREAKKALAKIERA